MLIANRLSIPDQTKAVLWDMDGVLLDTLGLDVVVSNQLIHRYVSPDITLSRTYIRSIFAYDPKDFWDFIAVHVKETYRIIIETDLLKQLLANYEHARTSEVFQLNSGILEILTDLKRLSIKTAVVSNNPTQSLKLILEHANIIHWFDACIGNDLYELAKKPAPDMYLYTAKTLSVSPKNCVVVEDSIVGAEAGCRAECFTIGVATGGADFSTLETSGFANCVYLEFLPMHSDLTFGNVTQKQLLTANDFISHMIEHIAWRMGLSINLNFYNNDWFLLGRLIGEQIHAFGSYQDHTMAMGIIDDGSAEIRIKRSNFPKCYLNIIPEYDIQWFLSLRCEQLHSGKPLVVLLDGLSQALKSDIHILVCSVEDPHHTWESIFRGLGIALSQMFTPVTNQLILDDYYEELPCLGDISVHYRSCMKAELSRKTAESDVKVNIDFSKPAQANCQFSVSDSIQIDPFSQLLSRVAKECDCFIGIEFTSTKLSSSHVVFEDVGILLGRTLKEIVLLRMIHYGIQGCGTSLQTDDQPICLALSIEGRKFLKFIPFRNSLDEFKKYFVIGHQVLDVLFSEDMDDFLDGFCQGLSASLVVHIRGHIANEINPTDGWPMIFQQLGIVIQKALECNPYRKGLPPGVKATLV